MSRLEGVFRKVRQEGRKGLIVYLCAGDPDLESSLGLVPLLEAAGADIVELGLPFSDPLADGPTLQASAHRALRKGVTTAKVLQGLIGLRSGGCQTPVVLMGSYNPLLAMGVPTFLDRAAEAGVDGLIVSDLPLDEASELSASAHGRGVDLIQLAAPTTPPARLASIAEATRGFLYFVSVTGVTGARKALPAGLPAQLDAARKLSALPVAVGFGISTPEQARGLSAHADAVVVGSALVQAIHEAKPPWEGPLQLVKALAAALRP